MNPTYSHGLVLAVHPTSRGFGWVLFEGPHAPVVWGIASAKRNRNATSMRRFEALLNQYQPVVVVLEEFAQDKSRRGDRIQQLAKTMSGFARNRDIDVAVYSREAVGRRVAGDRQAKRHAIAEAVCEQFGIFRLRMPNKRDLWQSEDSRQSLFDAVALAMTHFGVSRPKG